ncbi:MAG: hypothetical protein NZ781_01445 [Armatimonadetes bacterium]|nr:hypothetical protein [Armatimonadota bacterium]
MFKAQQCLSRRLLRSYLTAFTTIVLVSGVTRIAYPAESNIKPKLWDSYLRGTVINKLAIQGNFIWLGTSEGLFRLSLDNPSSAPLKFTKSDGLLDDDIQSLCADGNLLWIGLNNGVSCFDGRAFTNYTAANGLMDGAVLAIGANERYVWLGMDTGLARIDKATRRIANFRRYGGWTPEAGSGAVNPAAGSGKAIYCDSLLIAPDGTVWHAAFNLTHTSEDGKVIDTYHCGHGLIHSRILSMAWVGNDLWVASIGGIQRFNVAKRGELKHPFDLRFGSDFHHTVPNPPMRIAADGNILWVATKRDLTRFDTKRLRWLECREASTQLGEKMVLDMLPHGRYLWVATNDGLWRLDKHALENAPSELIADYEDRRLTEIFYPPIVGEFKAGAKSFKTSIDDTDGACNTSKSLRVDWAVPEEDVAHGRIHTVTQWVEFVDATRFDGIIFWVKTNKPATMTLTIRERNGEIWRGDAGAVREAGKWVKVYVPFEGLYLDENHVVNRVLELAQVATVEVQFVFGNAQAGDKLTLWLDEMRYIKSSATELASNAPLTR